MTLGELLDKEMAERHEAYIAEIEAMIGAYRGGKADRHDTMYNIANVITSKFNAPTPDPWDED
jgi:hypothetical protein